MRRSREFELFTGRTIRLLHLDQYLTYEGLPLGHPTRESNQEDLERLVERHTHPGGYGRPHLIEPAQEPLDPPASVPRHGTPATLPAITCIARFMSDVLPDDRENIASVLCVIWFQDDFAFPIDPLVMMELASIDWDACAVGWEP